MIITDKTYYIKCDGCKIEFTHGKETIRDVELSAKDYGWITIPQTAAEYKHYCPKCNRDLPKEATND
jgi:hypothetical protein